MRLAPISVDYIDHMGCDLSIVNAARVSFDKLSTELNDADIKLISYLAKHEHWSPFAHTSVQLRVKAPIFVARQLVKHQVGGVWNEVSRRYVSSEPEFYMPDEWRGKPVNAKQGSSDEIITSIEHGYYTYPTGKLVEDTLCSVISLYTSMIDQGVAPEMARMVLPQNMMTEWIWTGSLVFWARVCKLRLDPHAQAESSIVAREIAATLSHLFPHSWKALLA